MKIEIGESLACSYLRHVERCWLAQANWKVSEHWERSLPDADLEALFLEMKRRFDRGGAVFKQTKDAAQFLKQGEIDAVGVDRQGGVHAMEVAFHEAGLNYGSTAETDNRVLKKMLRTLLILRAHHPPQTALRISFLSPKVNPAIQRPLEATFADLRTEYPDVDWRLAINDEFVVSIVKPTLEKAGDVADSSELFVRSVKLLETAGYTLLPPMPNGPPPPPPPNGPTGCRIQPFVRGLMRTLLVDSPGLLSEEEKSDLQDNERCKSRVGLHISWPLIRRVDLGRKDSAGHDRYWKSPYRDFCVCNDWWKQHHRANAQALRDYVEDLIRRNPAREDALRPHAQAFRDYLEGNCP